MKIFMACASRHGSTDEIAERIAAGLRAAGHSVDLATAEPGRWLDDEHDGYVIGSAVYYGKWLRDARRFVAENASILADRPLWMFSSGPLGSEPSVGVTTGHLQTLIELTGARSHRTFFGRLVRSDLNPIERLVVRLVHAPYGDFRDWQQIDQWTAEIAADLESIALSQRLSDSTDEGSES
jgi:menaquinone-dependent protoporphyrinogen oxidase